MIFFNFYILSKPILSLLNDKIRKIIQEECLCSVMNNTKWTEFKKGISELPFLPPFVIKSVDEQETDFHNFAEDVRHSGDWGLYFSVLSMLLLLLLLFLSA